MNSQKSTARLAGLLYFLFILLFIGSSVLRSQLVVAKDAAATLANISALGWAFQLSIFFELVSLFFFVAAAWALYVLLKPVGKELALLFLLLNATGVAIECVSDLSMVGITLSVNGLKSFSATQQQDLVDFFLKLYQNGFMIAQLFFSTWLLPLGYLVFKSRFLPKALGVLLMLDFFFWFLYFAQYFLLPDFKAITYVSFPVAILAEFSLTFWLLIKGVKDVSVEKI